jgi:four helix bundle protein
MFNAKRLRKHDLRLRTKIFALNTIKLIVQFPKDLWSNHIKSQLIRCTTSVAANYSARCIMRSKKRVIGHINIVVEEIDESHFWLEFIIDEKLLSSDNYKSLLNEADELTIIFISSRKTANLNLTN